MSEDYTPEYVLTQWYRRARESQFAHHLSYLKFTKWHYRLGMPAVVLLTFISTSFFSTLRMSSDIKIQIFAGLITMIAAILGGLQVFYSFKDRAEDHKKAAARYGFIRRDMELLCSSDDLKPAIIGQLVKNRLDNLSDDSPTISDEIWHKVNKELNDDQSSFEAKYNGQG